MAIEKLYVDKRTDTSAETPIAFALAYLIDQLIPQNAGDPDIHIVDLGNCYVVSLGVPLEDEWISQASYLPLLRGIDTSKKKSGLPNAVDYTAHQERNLAYFEGLKQKMNEEQMREQGLVPPHRDWPVWAVVNQMSATNAYNQLAQQWEAHRSCFPDLLRIIFDLYGQQPNDEDAASKRWTELAKAHKIKGSHSASQLQVTNPGMGKGGNKSKASGLSIGGLKGFWISEYLKFVGLYECALPRSIRNSKDRKTYVLRPRDLSWRTHRIVFPEFQQSLYGSTSIKMDVLASLRYCLVYLRQWRSAHRSGRSRFVKSRPGDHVAALETVFYKHLGSAHATMNMSILVLPQWVPTIESVADADFFIELLTEHEIIVRNLIEKNSDEYSLLQTYRTFLSARDLSAFYQFTQGYATHVMQSLTGEGFPARRFQIHNLEALIMAHDPSLAEIVQNPGFRRVATAIRQSTVTRQYYKARRKELKIEDPYGVRYGLGNKLLRHASYPHKFIQELSKFIHAYTQENARILEQHAGKPPLSRVAVTDNDLEQIVYLIEKFDSETVAHLLVAFGYARKKTAKQDGEGQEDTEGEEPTADENIEPEEDEEDE